VAAVHADLWSQIDTNKKAVVIVLPAPQGLWGVVVARTGRPLFPVGHRVEI
jgi:hypothetical protein